MRDNMYGTLAKIGTVLVDRRFWMFIFSVVLSFVAVPYLAENQEQVATDVAGAVSMIFQGATILIGMVKMIDSWERRPPSGLTYNKPNVSESIDKIISALKDAGMQID